MGNLVGEAGLFEGCNGVAAANDGDSAFVRGFSHSFSHSQRAFSKSVEFEYAHRTVPNNRLSAFEGFNVFCGSLFAGVECLPAIGNFVHVYHLRVGISSEFVGDNEVNRQDYFYALFFGFFQEFTSQVVLVRFAEGCTDGQALGCIEGMCHAAADDDLVDFFNHVADYADFIGNLGTADDGHERMLRSFEGLADVVDFFFHQETGNHFRVLCDTSVGSMTAMGYTESIVNSNVSKASQLLSKFGVIFLFSFVITEVFEQQNFAGLEVSSSFFCFGAYAVSSPFYIFAEEFGEMLYEVLRGELRLTSFGRTANMAGQDYSCAVIEQVVDGRQGANHTGVVGDVLMFIERNVVVNADKYFFALDVNIFQGFLIHYVNLQK